MPVLISYEYFSLKSQKVVSPFFVHMQSIIEYSLLLSLELHIDKELSQDEDRPEINTTFFGIRTG